MLLTSAPTHLNVAGEQDPRMVAPPNGVPGTVKPGTNVTRSSAPRTVGDIPAAKVHWLPSRDRR